MQGVGYGIRNYSLWGVVTMSDPATKTDILYLKEQLNRIESDLEAIKRMIQKALSPKK